MAPATKAQASLPDTHRRAALEALAHRLEPVRNDPALVSIWNDLGSEDYSGNFVSHTFAISKMMGAFIASDAMNAILLLNYTIIPIMTLTFISIL